jgi:hypothetical protein
MKEDINKQVNRYKIVNSIENLLLLKEILFIKSIIVLYGELEIEPFKEFSTGFQAEYWYLKYYLLKDKTVQLKVGEFSNLYKEQSLNIIWLTVKDNESFILDCIDGEWYISFLKLDQEINTIFKKFKLIR